MLSEYKLFLRTFSGKTRARDAALNAIQSPLLDIGIERATGIVWNITGGSDLTLYEVGFSLNLRNLGTLLWAKRGVVLSNTLKTVRFILINNQFDPIHMVRIHRALVRRNKIQNSPMLIYYRENSLK